MATLIIPGRSAAQLKAEPLLGIRQSLKTRVLHAVDMRAARGAGSQERLEGVPEDAIIELTLDSGEKWYGALDGLRELFAPAAGRGAQGEEELTIPSTFTPDEQSRGWIGDITFAALRVIGIDLPALPARLLALQLEKQLEPEPGLYRCGNPAELRSKASARDFEPGKPALLLIHGTASSTRGSFGELAAEGDGETWKELQNYYGPRIFAFEHRTLSQSPLENAVELLKKLPGGSSGQPTELHLLTHSRGGLIGEILARGGSRGAADAFSPDDIRFFGSACSGDIRDSSLKALAELNRLFREKNIRASRFVRVACPAAGTTLAGGRLDRYLNTVVNLMERIPILGGSLIFDFVSAFMLAAVKTRMDPRVLPGLEAQMPGSALVRLLNSPGPELDSELFVVAGAAEGGGFLKSLLARSTAWYFGEDNDFVVDTRSMYGGAGRRSTAMRFFQKGAEVSHFRYFANKASRDALAVALRGKGQEAPFEALNQEAREAAVAPLDRSAPLPGAEQPIAFLVPGFMGSLLKADGEEIWLDMAAIAAGGMKKLGIGEPNVQPAGLSAQIYGRLAQFLSETHELELHAYDWRKSLLEEAELLARKLEQKLDETEARQQPIRLLAHSTGGLLVQAMMGIDQGKIWKRLTMRKGSRFIMMGTPTRGSYSMARLLLGREKILKLLSLADFRNDGRELQQLFARFPGALQLLPLGEGEPDFFAPETWKTFRAAMGKGWAPPPAEALQKAAAWRDFLQKEAPRFDPAFVGYIAGKAALTPQGCKIDGKEIRFTATPEGDGRAPWATAIPPELKNACWYMDAEHGGMPNCEEAFPAILELLQTGSTTKLPQEPPVSRGIPLGEVETEDEYIAQFPDKASLVAAALGYSPRFVSRPSAKKVKVSVTHGNLAYAHYPVAIGHYLGDGILSAEAVLDYHMKGRLTSRYRLGIYPGKEESAEVILDPGNFPPGAIVIGLGSFGGLSQGRLSRSVAFAAKELAVKQNELSLARPEGAGPAEPPRFSTLLIGSSYGGLTIQASIRAILSGVQQANQSLQNLGLADFMIDAVEFIEIYQDRAVQAAHSVRRIIREGRFEEMFFMEGSHLRKVAGGRRRLSDHYDQDWWHRLQVSQEGQEIRFTSLAGRARAEEAAISIAHTPIAQIIERAAKLDRWKPEDALAIFELLMPLEFKEYMADRLNILWIVDAKTAEYPWELLYDPSLDEHQPAAVRAGMIRQLKTEEYRANVENAVERSALVVGDPLLNDGRFQQLPGAFGEASLVSGLLKTASFQVQESLQEDAVRIFTALFRQNYKILHLAGHGVFNKPSDGEGKALSGMVLSDEALLSPAAVNQMRQVPDLVFINCCHLGAADAEAEHLESRNKLAANLGIQLIRMGVRAVVAAGWAVNDLAAQTFARVFYTEMLQGTPFGEAVRLARLEAYLKHPGCNSWGAYQCYGDPFYSLKGDGGGGSKKFEEYTDPMELIIELEAISGRAENASTRYIEKLKQQAEDIVKRTPREWLADSEVAEALANLYARLGMYEEAIRYFEMLKGMDKAGYSIRALEQLCNLKSRLGAIQFLEGEPGKGRAAIQEGIRLAGLLLQFGETVERYNLMGSAYKRLAVAETDARARREAISKAAEYYNKAYLHGAGDSNDAAYYSLPNWLLMEVLLEKAGVKKAGPEGQPENRMAEEEKLKNAEAKAQEDEGVNPTFWSGVNKADLGILRALINGDLDSQRSQEILDSFRKAWQRGGDFLKRRTVEEHLGFLISVLQPGRPAGKWNANEKNMQKLAEQFRELRARLLSEVFVE